MKKLIAALRNGAFKILSWSLWLGPTGWLGLRVFFLNNTKIPEVQNIYNNLDGAFTSVFIIAIIELMLHHHTKSELKEILNEGLTDPVFISRKSPSDQLDYLVKLSSALSNDDSARVITEHLYWPALHNYNRFRNSNFFEYVIRDAAKDYRINLAGSSILFSKRDYFARYCRSNFSISRKFFKFSGDGDYYISFCLSGKQNSLSHADQYCLFRLQIPLSLDHQERIFSISSSEWSGNYIEEFIYCQIRVGENLYAIEPEISYSELQGFKLILTGLKGLIQSMTVDDEDVLFNIEAIIPHSKEQKFLSAIWSEPTKVKFLSFRFEASEISKIEYNSYLTVNATKRVTLEELSENNFSTNLHGSWIFPVSGVVFIWS